MDGDNVATVVIANDAADSMTTVAVLMNEPYR